VAAGHVEDLPAAHARAKAALIPARILAVYHRAETFGGSFNSVLDVLQRVDPSRFQVSCGVPGAGNVADTFRALGFPVHWCRDRPGAKTPAYALAVASTLRLLSRERTDLLYVTDHVWWRSSALLAARLAGRATVVHLRSPREDIAQDPEILSATMIVGNSEATVSPLRTRLPPERLRVVPNFIDFPAFDAPRDIRDTFFPSSPPVVGFVGVFRPEKGIEYFLEMARQVHDVSPQVRFLAVGGESSVEDIGWFDRMRKYADSLGLTPVMHFTGARTDVANLMMSMDVVAVPSLNEGFGRVIVEANAVGRLVVGANAAGIPEVIQPGVSGVLVPPRDSTALAEGVTRVLDDEDWRRRAERELPVLTRRRFSPELQMTRLQAAWEDALTYNRRA
jgi:glycosyltransferase involved in cell wall biosynthesis